MIRLRNIVWSNLVLFGILMSEVNSTLSKSTTDSNCHTLKSPHIFQIFNIRNKNNCLHELGWSCDQILWSPKGFLEDLTTYQPNSYSDGRFNVVVYFWIKPMVYHRRCNYFIIWWHFYCVCQISTRFMTSSSFSWKVNCVICVCICILLLPDTIYSCSQT